MFAAFWRSPADGVNMELVTYWNTSAWFFPSPREYDNDSTAVFTSSLLTTNPAAVHFYFTKGSLCYRVNTSIFTVDFYTQHKQSNFSLPRSEGELWYSMETTSGSIPCRWGNCAPFSRIKERCHIVNADILPFYCQCHLQVYLIRHCI